MEPADYCAAQVRAADLDRYLAILYAPVELRPALFALHALDVELATVARTTTEPMIGQIRLAWWREALEKLDTAPPPAQPVLEALAGHVLPRGVAGASLTRLEDGFLALIGGEAVDARDYADARGGTLFEAAATALGVPPAALPAARTAGIVWACAQALASAQPEDAAEARRVGIAAHAELRALPRLPSSGRLLIGLAALARRDLDGEHPPHRGSPARQMRLLWSIITGTG